MQHTGWNFADFSTATKHFTFINFRVVPIGMITLIVLNHRENNAKEKKDGLKSSWNVKKRLLSSTYSFVLSSVNYDYSFWNANRVSSWERFCKIQNQRLVVLEMWLLETDLCELLIMSKMTTISHRHLWKTHMFLSTSLCISLQKGWIK